MSDGPALPAPEKPKPTTCGPDGFRTVDDLARTVRGNAGTADANDVHTIHAVLPPGS
ncbi:hypothetical protein AB0E81_18870 [Streptomyces sp. NPDC033538]|uniref:hypothetical protein n=1 Tax=Streptomyces sp. NPDC033538 TaxID=3155367 RepID=UPI00340DBF08